MSYLLYKILNNIQTTTWQGKRMQEKCMYDSTMYFWFNENLLSFPVLSFILFVKQHLQVFLITVLSFRNLFFKVLHFYVFFVFQAFYVSENCHTFTFKSYPSNTYIHLKSFTDFLHQTLSLHFKPLRSRNPFNSTCLYNQHYN